MPITTSGQANDYAIRMHNDEYWSRIYTPDLKGLTLTSCPTSKQSFYKFPVTLKLEREMIDYDDLDGYVGRFDGFEFDGEIPDDLPDLDQGIITIALEMVINYPFCFPDNLPCEELAKQIGLDVIDYSAGSMGENIQLSDHATSHLIQRVNEKYMCIDMLYQNLGLLETIKKKLEKYKAAFEGTKAYLIKLGFDETEINKISVKTGYGHDDDYKYRLMLIGLSERYEIHEFLVETFFMDLNS